MAAVFDPDKYLNSDEWKIAVDPASSHYEKLGFRFGDLLSNEQINDAFFKRYEWWNEKDKISRRGGHAHPTIKIVGPSISEAMKNLIEAKSILSDTTKKSQYDNNLREEINKKDEEDLIRYIRFALQGDNQISQEEKRNLLNMADTLKIKGDRAEEIIIAEMKKVGATFKSKSDSVDSTSSSMPFDVLLNKTYYELLGLSEDAEYSQIKEVHDREFQEYNKARDKKRAEARWIVVCEAWECLRNPAKRRKYGEEQRRKREKGLTREGAPKLEIVDESGKEKRSFEFKDMKLGDRAFVTVTAKNGGGGTLDANIKTNRSWLIVDTNKVHQGKLPQRISITVDPKKDSRKNTFGGKDTGLIEISYKKEGQVVLETIQINFNIEMPEADLKRFRLGLTIGSLIFGGLFGHFIYNLSLIQGMNVAVAGIAGLAALIGTVIAAGKIGYQNDGAGAAIGSGVVTLVVLFIIIAILDSYFPHALSVFSWTLVYGSFANLLSTPIRRAFWRGNLTVPMMAGTMILALTVGIIYGGFVSAKQERDAEIVRSKAELIRSNAIQKIIQATAKKLPGEWHGNMDKTKIKLFITRGSNQLSGKILHYKYGVEQKLSVNFKNKAGQIVIILKGTSYKKRLKGKGTYYLDTFYGTLSRDGRTIKGTYEDTCRNRGKWSVSKLSPHSVRLFVKTKPAGARIRVLNIGPKFYQGMKLSPGRYHVEISDKGYKTKETWVDLCAGHDKTINICLTRKMVVKRQRRYDDTDIPLPKE